MSLQDKLDAFRANLEAGGPPRGLFIEMPVAFPRYAMGPALNWNFVSEPEPGLDGPQRMRGTAAHGPMPATAE